MFENFINWIISNRNRVDPGTLIFDIADKNGTVLVKSEQLLKGWDMKFLKFWSWNFILLLIYDFYYVLFGRKVLIRQVLIGPKSSYLA